MPRIRITDQYALIKRTGSPHWYLEWRERGQKIRRSCGTGSVEAARVAAREIILESARIVDQSPNDMPMTMVIARYMAQRGSKLAGASANRDAAKRWDKFFARDTVADLTVDRIEAFIDWLRGTKSQRGTPLAPSYIRRVMALGKAALNRAHQRQEITSVPHIPLPSAGEPWPHVASRDELVRWLNAIAEKPTLLTYTMIRLNTCCRGDAALDLQPFQIDFDARVARLNPPGRQQTKKYRPVVPLTNTLAAFLRDAKATPYYVRSHRRDSRLGDIKKAWGTARAAANLPAHFQPKILRHTVASELRKRGVPGWEVSALIGHSRGEAQATTAVYAKFDPAWMTASRTALDAWMADLASDVPALLGVSAGPALYETKTARPVQSRAVIGGSVVELIGIEPMTSTMPLSQKERENSNIDAQKSADGSHSNQSVVLMAGSVRGQSRRSVK